MTESDDPKETQLLRHAFAVAKPATQAGCVRQLSMQRVIAAVLAEGAARPMLGRYVIEERIGGGGMGVVYRASDPLHATTVAIKVLDRASAGDLERFAREIQILASLRHPAIVRYIDHGQTATGDPYLVMEWLEGHDLAGRLRERGLTIDETLHLAIRLAQALAAAHGREIVHRDLKPANVFLPHGRLEDAKLLDFGVARSSSDHLDGPAQGITRSGVLVGTPAYMAPEQIQGHKVLDGRCDLFALGCTIYECLVGHPVFAADHVVAVLARVLFQEPNPLAELRPEIPAALAALIHELLAKDPQQRPANAQAVIERLQALGQVPGGVPTPGAMRFHLSPGEVQVVSVVIIRYEGQLDAIQAVAKAHGARLERVTYSAVVAVMSGRAAAVDLAASAVGLALALRALVPHAAIAVATGRGEWSLGLPIGDAIDRGARLILASSAGVRLDEISTALLSSRFDLVWADDQLLEMRALAISTRTLLGRPMPCLGRERELAQLDTALEECQTLHVARAIVVTAAAGVGKSRLAHEWQRRLVARPHPPRVLFGRSEPVSSGSSFFLAAQLVRRGLGLRDDDSPAQQRQALSTQINRRGFEPLDTRRLECFLSELLGLVSDDAEVHDEIVAARTNPLLMNDQIRIVWEDWLHSELVSGPLVLVVEDLHWADPPSVRLLETALRSLKKQPFAILALARPEVRTRFANLWANFGVCEVHLGELSALESEAMIRAALGEAANPATVAWIRERAGGHALYLEETIRAVAQGRRDGAPASVLAMVQARLATFSADTRMVLRAASIFGAVFWRGALVHLTGQDESEVVAILDELVDHEAIVPRRHSRFGGEAEFAFRHNLFHEAAGHMLTPADRVLGHRLAAQWLIDAGERQSIVLAEHFEAGDDAKPAVEWYLRAAEEALLSHDFDGALARTARGIALGAEELTLGRLLLIDSEARTWQANDGSGETTALDALAHFVAGSSYWYDALRLALSARIPARKPLLDEIVGHLHRTTAEESALRNYAMVLVVASEHLSFHGEHGRSLDFVAKAEALSQQGPLRARLLGWTLRARGSALLFAGQHAAALPAYLRAAEWFESRGDRREVCSLGTTIGWLQATELGLHDHAEPTLRKTLKLAEELGLPGVVSSAKQNLAVALMHLQRYEPAKQLLNETVDEFERRGDGRLSAGSRFYLTQLYTLLGDPQAAEAQALAALELARKVPTTTACVLAAYARALLTQGRNDDALLRARAAAAILEELGGIEEGESLIVLTLAEALHACGDFTGARATLSAAAARLQVRAATMNDNEIRRAFLERVPEHARTQELVCLWNGNLD